MHCPGLCTAFFLPSPQGFLGALQGPQPLPGTVPAGSWQWRVWQMLFPLQMCTRGVCPQGCVPTYCSLCTSATSAGACGGAGLQLLPPSPGCDLPTSFTAVVCHVPRQGRDELRSEGPPCMCTPYGHLCGAGAHKVPASPSPFSLCTKQAELWCAASCVCQASGCRLGNQRMTQRKHKMLMHKNGGCFFWLQQALF